MRRGFKADAERHAAALRDAVGCSDRETMALPRLAAHLKVAVLAGDRVLGSNEPFRALHVEQSGAFSAATLHLPDGRTVVIYNPITFSGDHLDPHQAKRDGRTRSNVWHYLGVNTFRAGRMDELRMHPTVKPVALVADAMRDCSRRGDIVLDTFVGSGTTIIAAEQIGRRGSPGRMTRGSGLGRTCTQ